MFFHLYRESDNEDSKDVKSCSSARSVVWQFSAAQAKIGGRFCVLALFTSFCLHHTV